MDNNIAVVCIARLEGLYIREFIEHYKNLGFSNVILCDNNHDNEEDLPSIVQDYINSGYVIYEDFKNQVRAQMGCYTSIYAKYKTRFSAFFFVDVDEYLILNQDENVVQFLSRFPENWEAVVVNWKVFTDNNKVHYEPKPLMERFTEPMEKDKFVQYGNVPENAHVKTFIKGGLPNVVFYSNPHVSTVPLVTYNANGQRCDNSPFQPINWDVACINHYVTKSTEEYCMNKLRRGSGDRDYQTFLKTYAFRYFRYNQVTPEKLAYLDRNGIKGI